MASGLFLTNILTRPRPLESETFRPRMTSFSSSAGSRFFADFGMNGGLVLDDLEVVNGIRVVGLLVVVVVVVVGVGVVDDVVLVVVDVVVKVRAGGRGMLLLLITAIKKNDKKHLRKKIS